MNAGLIIAGLILISEPCVSFIDIIPDFIGVFLIIRGISRMEAAFPSAEDSVSFFRKYAVASLIVTAGTLPALSVCSGDPAMHMAFSVASGIVCAYFALKAFGCLFNVFDYLNETTGILYRTSSVRIASAVLIISKYLFAFLPQLVFIDIDSGSDMYGSAYYKYAPYRNTLMIICGLISAVISVICLIILIRFFKSVSSDAVFTREVNSSFLSAPAKQGKAVKRSVFGGLAFLLWAAWLTLPLELDSRPAIPFFASGLFLIISFISLRLTADVKKSDFLRAGLFAGSGLVAYIAIVSYLESHHMYTYDSWFFVISAVYIVYLILGLITALSVIRNLKAIIDLHGGSLLDSDSGSLTASVLNERSVSRVMCTVSFCLLSLSAVSGAVTFFFQRRHPEFRIIHLAVYFVFCVIFTLTAGKIKSLAADRYSAE